MSIARSTMFVLKSTSSFARSISAGGYVPFVLRKSRSGRKRWRSMYLPSVEVRSLELVAMVLEIAQRAGERATSRFAATRSAAVSSARELRVGPRRPSRPRR